MCQNPAVNLGGMVVICVLFSLDRRCWVHILHPATFCDQHGPSHDNLLGMPSEFLTTPHQTADPAITLTLSALSSQHHFGSLAKWFIPSDEWKQCWHLFGAFEFIYQSFAKGNDEEEIGFCTIRGCLISSCTFLATFLLSLRSEDCR